MAMCSCCLAIRSRRRAVMLGMQGISWSKLFTPLICVDICSVVYDPPSRMWLWQFRANSRNRTRVIVLGLTRTLDGTPSHQGRFDWPTEGSANPQPVHQSTHAQTQMMKAEEKAEVDEESGLALWASPTAALDVLQARLEERGFLLKRNGKMLLTNADKSREQTLHPQIYSVRAVPYRGNTLALVASFLGRRRHEPAVTETVNVIDVGLASPVQISSLPKYNVSSYSPLIGYLEDHNESQYIMPVTPWRSWSFLA